MDSQQIGGGLGVGRITTECFNTSLLSEITQHFYLFGQVSNGWLMVWRLRPAFPAFQFCGWVS